MGRIHKYLNKLRVYQRRQVVRGKRQAWPGRAAARRMGEGASTSGHIFATP